MKTFKHFYIFIFAIGIFSCQMAVPNELESALLNNYEKKWKCESIDYSKVMKGNKNILRYQFNDCMVARDSILWFMREVNDIQRYEKKYNGVEFIIVNKGFADTVRYNF